MTRPDIIEYLREIRDRQDPESDAWEAINAAMHEIDDLVGELRAAVALTRAADKDRQSR